MTLDLAADLRILWWLLAGLLILIGIAGTVLPALPGVVLVFFGLLLGAWIDGFTRVSGVTMGILAILTVLSYLVDFVATSLGAKKYGASTRAIAGAALGTLAGIFFGIPGLIVGPSRAR